MLSCGFCPECMKKNVKVQMLYDPKEDVCYCPVCGYTEPANTLVLPVPKENDVQFSIVSVVDNDKGLGGLSNPIEIQKILRNGFKKKRVSIKKANILQVHSDVKSFKENKVILEMIINCIKQEYELNIPKYIYDETVYEVSRILKRSDINSEVRYYNTIEVFLVVLYHVMLSHYLRFHKMEILDMISSCAVHYIKGDDTVHTIKRTISRRYGRLQHLLPRYNITLKDKVRAVSERYGVEPKLVEMFLNYIMSRVNIQKYDLDNVIFASVYFVKEEILGEKIDEDDKIIRSGIRSLKSLFMNSVQPYFIRELKLYAKKYNKKEKN